MRKHNYLVGYEGDNQCVYGKRRIHKFFCGFSDGIAEPMTLNQAKRLSEKITCQNGKKTIKSVIYKLVKL